MIFKNQEFEDTWCLQSILNRKPYLFSMILICWFQDIVWILSPSTYDTTLRTKVAKPSIDFVIVILFGILYYYKINDAK